MDEDAIDAIRPITPILPILHHGPTGESYERDGPEAHWGDGETTLAHDALEAANRHAAAAYGAGPAAIWIAEEHPHHDPDASGTYDSTGHRVIEAE